VSGKKEWKSRASREGPAFCQNVGRRWELEKYLARLRLAGSLSSLNTHVISHRLMFAFFLCCMRV